MQSNWKVTTVGEFCPFIYGKNLPASKRNPGKIKVYGSNGVVGLHNEPLINEPGIIIGRKGTVGTVHYSNGPFWAIDTTFYVTASSRRDLKFTFYVLKSLGLEKMNSDSAVPGLNRDTAHACKLNIPPLPVQKKISFVLSSLDNKIEVLKEMNDTLEAIAQTIFKSWFVDFDPVHAKAKGQIPEGVDTEIAALFSDSFDESILGKVPKGWKISALGDWISVLETGKRPKGGVGEIKNGVPSIGAESIIRVGQFNYTKTKYVSHDFYEKMRSGKLQSYDVLLYKDGGKPGVFLPRVSMFGEGFPFNECGINEHVFRIRINEPFNQTFLYFWLWSDISMHELKHRGGKAAIPGINQSDVRELKILVPTKKILDNFNILALPLFTKILKNAQQIKILESLRDALLPRLISGQLQLQDEVIKEDAK